LGRIPLIVWASACAPLAGDLGQAQPPCTNNPAGGVELGAREYRNLHILGYGYSLGPSPLADLCNQMRQGREERKYRIIDFLREKGVDISLAEVEELAGEEYDYITSEITRRIGEAFSADSRILSAENFVFSEEGNGVLFCSFDVVTVFGTFREEVIL